MKYRALGRTGLTASEISFGSWAIGGEWGAVDDEVSHATLNAAVDSGVTFIDTADGNGMGRSEGLLARLRSARKEPLFVATKAGRKLDPHTAGEIRCHGASVEKIDEALAAINFPGVATVQIIFNIFLQRPAEVLFPAAARWGVGSAPLEPEALRRISEIYDPQVRSLVPSPLVKGASS